MSNSGDSRRTFSRGHALHLLWTIPVALVVTYVAAFWIGLTWCGISGCSGGGFGRISSPSITNLLIGAGVIAVVWFAAIAAVPWARSRPLRMLTGAGVGIVAAIAVATYVTDGFVA